MKIYFLLGNLPAYLYHGVAKEFKRRYGWSESSAYVVGTEPFNYLVQQDDIEYQDLASHEKVFPRYRNIKLDQRYLDRLESEFGLPTLWPYVYADRNLVVFTHHETHSHRPFSHDDIRRLLQFFFSYFIEKFKDLKPDVIIAYAVASMPALVAYHVARKMQIPFLCPVSARVRDRYIIVRNPYDRFESVKAMYDKLLAGQIQEWDKEAAQRFINEFRSRPSSPSYSRVAKRQARVYQTADLQKAIRLLRAAYSYYLRPEDRNNPRKVAPPRKVLDWLKLKLRSAIMHKERFFDQPIAGEPYGYYPLHVEPEASTMILASFYLNQIALLENVAKSIPINFKLYVKEHVPMIGKRPLSYYEQLRRIPNVRLIDPHANSLALVKNSRLVMTITGTAGWEGLLLGKPVIIFGNVFYNKLSMVRKVECLTSLPAVISDLLLNYEPDDDKLVKFVAAILDKSFPLDAGLLWGENPPERLLAAADAINSLTTAFAREIGVES